MANSQFMYTVNKILSLVGEDSIASVAAFGDVTQQTRFQMQAITFVDLADRMLLTHMNERFMQRHYYLNTSNETANAKITVPLSYSLDASISAESVLWHSFLVNTPNSCYPLRNWDYREFRRIFPNMLQVPASIPRLWILLPTEITDVPQTHKIIFYPRPNAVYQIEYMGKLNAQPLVNAADAILFPPEYEHVLWLQGRLFLEQALGEGKESDIAVYVQRAIDEIKSWASAPVEQRSAVRPGLLIAGVRRGRARRPSTFPISQ